jgi:hypothetical protein
MMRPADTSPAMSEKNNPNKNENISEPHEVDDLQVIDFAGAPGGIRIPNPQIRSSLQSITACTDME